MSSQRTVGPPRFVSAALVASAVLFVGCGAKDDHPAVVAVTGHVSLNGEPVGQAIVTLKPTDGRGQTATAVTDAEGNFAPSTAFDLGKTLELGMLPGQYAVSVVKLNSQSPPKVGPLPNLLPGRYASAERSGLTASIPEGADPELLFELTK